MSALQQIWREAWKPPDRRPPWAWCEEHITSIPYSPVPGRFRSDNSPWMREPMEALVDPRIRLVSIIAAIQSGKTSVGELGISYIIANLPGPTLWLDQTDDDARDQSESRLQKLFDNPLSPALRSGPTTAPGASPKSKFLAARRKRGKPSTKCSESCTKSRPLPHGFSSLTLTVNMSQ